MKEFIISCIEENEIGVHKKEILVVGEDFQSCYEEHIKKYPTMVGIVQQFDEEHTVNFIRPNNIQIEKVTDEIFEEEETSFIAEPFFNYINHYEYLSWKYIYSFPIYFVIYLISYKLYKLNY